MIANYSWSTEIPTFSFFLCKFSQCGINKGLLPLPLQWKTEMNPKKTKLWVLQLMTVPKQHGGLRLQSCHFFFFAKDKKVSSVITGILPSTKTQWLLAKPSPSVRRAGEGLIVALGLTVWLTKAQIRLTAVSDADSWRQHTAPPSH